jgi:putative phosphoesterase
MSRGAWPRNLPMIEERLHLALPVRFAVVSDTHVMSAGRRQTLDPILDLFRRANPDMFLHAGDAGSLSLLETLEAIAPVAAVRGNADPVALIDVLPDRVWIEAGERLVLLMHGHHGRTARQAALAAVAPNVDLIVFGHSHQPLIERHGSTILFNPGSPTERRWNPHFGVGLVDISDTAIEPELILFDAPRHLANVKL